MENDTISWRHMIFRKGNSSKANGINQITPSYTFIKAKALERFGGVFMMQLVTKRIHMNRRRGPVTSQMTLDDDFNVPDSMEDVSHLMLEYGEIQIESVRNLGERAMVKGKLTFRVLYRTPDGQIMTLAGAIPFEESINMPELQEQDDLQVMYELDDLSVGTINSRKLNVKALVTFHLLAETIEDVAAAASVVSDGTVETLEKEIEIAVLAVRRKDTYRVKEVMTLPGNRPDIDRLLWQEVKLHNVNTKPLDGMIHIDGELLVFLIYSGADGRMPIHCLEESIAFSGKIDLSEADADMIPFITVRLIHKDVEVNPDSDGEMREIAVDAVIELDMRLYKEEEIKLLGDLYALDRELIPQHGTVCFDQIITKNQSKHKIQEKVSLSDGQRILQICHADATVRVDEVQMRDDGLPIDGVLEAELISLNADDGAPVAVSTKLLPFHVIADVPAGTKIRDYRLEAGVEQIAAVMLGQDTVEVKAVITMDLLVFGEACEPVILQVQEGPLNLELLKKKPGIVGYVVQPGDSLWKIAREFHTSVDEIMTANKLTDYIIHPGDKLILVKSLSFA